MGGWSTSRPGRFTPAKRDILQRLGGSKASSGRVWKISLAPGFDLPLSDDVAILGYNGAEDCRIDTRLDKQEAWELDRKDIPKRRIIPTILLRVITQKCRNTGTGMLQCSSEDKAASRSETSVLYWVITKNYEMLLSEFFY